MIRYPLRIVRRRIASRSIAHLISSHSYTSLRNNSSKPINDQEDTLKHAKEIDTEYEDILARLDRPSKIENDTFNLTNDVEPDSTEMKEDFQLLNDFITKEYEADKEPDSMKNITNLTQEILDYSPVDIDQTDEKFDVKFLDVNEESDSKIIEDEKQLFQNIFNSYMEPMQKKLSLDWDAKESIYSTKQKIDSMLRKLQHHELAKVSKRLREELFEKTKDALAPTLAHIGSISTPSELVMFFESIMAHWAGQLDANTEQIYLNDFLKQYNEYTTIHEEFVQRMAQESASNPLQPALNVFTFPIVFNGILKTAAFKLYDGQLCLTLFNMLKKDLNLYSIACNQETYNEILRILWIYNGKSNLYTIEMLYMEMKNNGFNGDVVTFNTLKQIIIDYHSMKMGKLEVNKATGLPIWSKEDDKRINNLERNLRHLVQSIYKEEGL